MKTLEIVAALLLSFSLSVKVSAAPSPLPSSPVISRIETAISRGAKPSEKDLEDLAQLIANEPNNAKAHILLAVCYEQLGLPKQSIAEYRSAINLAPNDPRPYADVLKLMIASGQIANASGLLETASQKFPNDPDIVFVKGFNELHNGHITAADALFVRALKVNPEIPWLKASYSEVLLDEGHYRQAWRYATAALQQDPNNPKANMVEGLALAHLGRIDQSVNYLGRASMTMPERLDLSEKLARLDVWTGRYNDAIAAICLNLAQTPYAVSESAEMPKLLLECFSREPKQKVMPVLDKISNEFEPAKRNSHYHCLLGELLASIGWNDAAVDELRSALSIQPDNGRAAFALGRECEFYLHDYNKALTYYRQAQSLGTSGTMDVADCINRLLDRLAKRKSDVAWQLKDFLTTPHN